MGFISVKYTSIFQECFLRNGFLSGICFPPLGFIFIQVVHLYTVCLTQLSSWGVPYLSPSNSAVLDANWWHLVTIWNAWPLSFKNHHPIVNGSASWKPIVDQGLPSLLPNLLACFFGPLGNPPFYVLFSLQWLPLFRQLSGLYQGLDFFLVLNFLSDSSKEPLYLIEGFIDMFRRNLYWLYTQWWL